MKKFIFSFLFLILCLTCNAQINFTNMSDVVQCNLSKNEIYSNIMQNWTNLNGANQKGINSLDYCDKDAGVINIKTKIYLGWHKVNMLYGYNGYANSIITYRIKDNKYKVTLVTNTVTFEWSAESNPESETVDIKELYPKYIAKTKLYYIKKSSNDLVLEKMPNIMNTYFNLCKTLHINNEDDF